jgi:hypothetical protein
MWGKYLVLFLSVLLPLRLQAEGLSQTKILGIAGFTCSLIAIGTDILSEHYYNKYKEATNSNECLRYKKRVVWCERTRDISFGLSIIGFSVSTILWLKETRTEVGIEINWSPHKLCAGIVKSLY